MPPVRSTTTPRYAPTLLCSHRRGGMKCTEGSRFRACNGDAPAHAVSQRPASDATSGGCASSQGRISNHRETRRRAGARQTAATCLRYQPTRPFRPRRQSEPSSRTLFWKRRLRPRNVCPYFKNTPQVSQYTPSYYSAKRECLEGRRSCRSIRSIGADQPQFDGMNRPQTINPPVYVTPTSFPHRLHHSRTYPPHSRTLPRHSREGRPLNNLSQGMGMETGARKMKGAIMGRASQNSYSA